jgi:hypothetical protein
LGILLALHIIIIVWPAASSDEVSGAEKRCRAGTDFLYLGDMVGERSEIV